MKLNHAKLFQYAFNFSGPRSRFEKNKNETGNRISLRLYPKFPTNVDVSPESKDLNNSGIKKNRIKPNAAKNARGLVPNKNRSIPANSPILYNWEILIPISILISKPLKQSTNK